MGIPKETPRRSGASFAAVRSALANARFVVVVGLFVVVRLGVRIGFPVLALDLESGQGIGEALTRNIWNMSRNGQVSPLALLWFGAQHRYSHGALSRRQIAAIDAAGGTGGHEALAGDTRRRERYVRASA